MKRQIIVGASVFVAMLGLQLLLPIFVAAGSLRSTSIVALGDSYTSGNGAGRYYGKPGCYRSSNSYAHVYVDTLREHGYSVRLQLLACSGAKIIDIRRQAARLTKHDRVQADVVLLTIGGNDVRFGSIVRNCFVPVIRLTPFCYRSINRAKASLGTISSRLRATLRFLTLTMPNAKIVLVGYPQLLDYCPGNTLFRMRSGYRSGWQVRQVGHRAHKLLRSLAGGFSNVQYINLQPIFKGHEVCGRRAPYLEASFSSLNHREWWHPNRRGHRAIARQLLRNIQPKGRAVGAR